MVYPLIRTTKEGTKLHPHNSFYSEEYAQRMCELYLTDQLERDESGKFKRFYRLHASKAHTPEMALAYDLTCPKCGAALKQVGRQNSLTELGLYACKKCNK